MVKASGKKLRDALNENIFVALDLEKLKIKFSDPDMKRILIEKNLRI